jgi:hypothetical protein
VKPSEIYEPLALESQHTRAGLCASFSFIEMQRM